MPLYDTSAVGSDDDSDSLLWNDSALKNLPDVEFDVSAGKSTKHLPPSERKREIERRERKARRLENELRTRENAQKAVWKKFKGEKNWPLSCWSIAHHSITEDIPLASQSKVRKMYFLWILNAVALLWNAICYLIWSSWPSAKEEKVTLSESTIVLLAIFYVCAGIPLSWLLWYKKYYNIYAGKVNEGKLSLRYFANFGLHTIFAALMMTGYETIASAGLLAMLKCLAHVTSLGMLLLVALVLWGMVALASVWLIRQQHIDYGLQIAGKYISEQHGVGEGSYGDSNRERGVISSSKGRVQ